MEKAASRMKGSLPGKDNILFLLLEKNKRYLVLFKVKN